MSKRNLKKYLANRGVKVKPRGTKSAAKKKRASENSNPAAYNVCESKTAADYRLKINDLAIFHQRLRPPAYVPLGVI